jgi:uncharacterized protein YydD (DUF2326 family)
MRISRLYTEPSTIDPIVFEAGVNVILGESDDTSSKNNGVGKSLCIEFLNFALLKRKAESRVAKIPKASFDPLTLICVDFEMNGFRYTIKRSLEESEHPRIVVDGHETVYAKVEDATDFLTGRLYDNHDARVREQRGKLWPDVDFYNYLWHRKRNDGFVTIPRTMPLIIGIIDDLTKGRFNQGRACGDDVF